jgi:hypothetical protein
MLKKAGYVNNQGNAAVTGDGGPGHTGRTL